MTQIPGKKFSVAHSHATAAVATQAAPGAGKRIFITDIAASSDKAGAILSVIEDVGGTPVTKWEVQVGAGVHAYSFKTPIQITANKTATVQIDGTSLCKANMAGKIISH